MKGQRQGYTKWKTPWHLMTFKCIFRSRNKACLFSFCLQIKPKPTKPRPTNQQNQVYFDLLSALLRLFVWTLLYIIRRRFVSVSVKIILVLYYVFCIAKPMSQSQSHQNLNIHLDLRGNVCTVEPSAAAPASCCGLNIRARLEKHWKSVCSNLAESNHWNMQGLPQHRSFRSLWISVVPYWRSESLIQPNFKIKGQYLPTTVGHCSFFQMLLKQEEIVFYSGVD